MKVGVGLSEEPRLRVLGLGKVPRLLVYREVRAPKVGRRLAIIAGS